MINWLGIVIISSIICSIILSINLVLESPFGLPQPSSKGLLSTFGAIGTILSIYCHHRRIWHSSFRSHFGTLFDEAFLD